MEIIVVRIKSAGTVCTLEYYKDSKYVKLLTNCVRRRPDDVTTVPKSIRILSYLLIHMFVN
jgi:hypothetical protein